ncbi:YraN family protein [Marinospirillum perlucidum]|uniref:YraN family protein n=1 Tax=Marinospirillum perlucidum TaxID=1982602 RepID=UPI000DF20678|nr:YraN family protein [Marinospirillum perlucidum]
MVTRPQHLHRGKQAEITAKKSLLDQGLQLVAENFHCPLGEIDLILWDGDTLVFTEVRFRKTNAFGGAVASITPAKQRRIQRTAEVFLQRLKTQPPCRFDVLAMSEDSDGHILCQNWIKNAF